MVPILLVTLAALAPTAFDKVLLKDGRLIEGRLLETEDTDKVLLRLPGADIPIARSLVDKTYVEDLEDYVPKDKKEEEYLKKGWVLFEGRWMSRTRREQELQDRADADQAAIDQARKEQDWKNRKRIETRHFIIESNCTQEILDQAADLFETYYENFVDFWSIKLSVSEGKSKMKFFFYRDTPNFHHVTNTGGGLGGFFSPLDRELHLPYDQEDPAKAWAVLLHEGNHLLAYLIDPGFRYPIWVNEGMAEYYGTAIINAKGKFELGGLQYGRIVSLRNDEANGRTIGLRDLLLTEQETFNARHYAAAWSFVHFLMESPKYGKPFRTFFKTLPRNRDLELDNKTVRHDVGTWAFPRFPSVVKALENALGTSIEDLESEWQDYTAQTYGELTPNAYYLAARIARFNPLDNDEHIVNALTYYEKAVELGIQNAGCYRDYAEMLRKGGVDDGSYTAIVQPPDALKAWDMIQKAIELDPVQPLNYTEAAGILILDGPSQDLDKALAMVETAKALNSRSATVRSLTDELLALIEPAREKAAKRAAAEAALRANDNRRWIVQPSYADGQDVPEKIEDLSTQDLRDLIRAGTVTGKDWVFQTYREADPETGELRPGTETWDDEWVLLQDVPVFADDLAAVAG